MKNTSITNPGIGEYFELFLVFCKIGVVTFGGGLAMLPILERELAEKRDWTTREQLLDYYAIGQSTPGIIAVNVATFIGYNRKGIFGGILTTIGVVTPSVIIITLIASLISNFQEILWVQKALRGINAAVAALLVSAVLKLGKSGVKNWFGMVIAVGAFAAIAFFDVSSVFIILTAAALGLGYKTLFSDKQKPKTGEEASR
ncbi:MAG: chromate transporter [Spirochaetaceae bacterium]|jgi:chromate transporter|nr:chromate transporter [Spirochaetaceae bacterium]